LFNKKSNEILLTCKVINRDSKSTTLYKLEEEDFCDGLAYLNIIECGSKPEKEGHYSPCKARIQIDNMSLNDNNTIKLKGNSQYEFFIKIQCEKLTLRIKKNKCYKLQLSLNHNNIVSYDNIPVFKERLLSNEIILCDSKLK